MGADCDAKRRGMDVKRLHSLDALRGIAALSVVVWHWQHFFALSGHFQSGWQRDWQPFFQVLRPLYGAGWMAVDLFFALSGFVFFWLYADAIKTSKIRAGTFALLRLSRLYPLHLATLLLVAGLQYVFWRQTGSFFIFESGNWPRFAAALLMAQQWLPPTEWQFFNGPTWSVSIEVLLYILFFMACRRGMAGPRHALAIAGVGLLLLPFNQFIARGVMGFFIGGVVFYATEWAMARPDARRNMRVAILLAVLGWSATLAEGYFGVLQDGLARLGMGGRPEIFLLLFVCFVSPATVAALALHERLQGGRFQALSFLGDISYSTYLLHFPLQLICVLVGLRLGWTPMTFMHPVAMLAFFGGLIALGAASHYGFEKPLQALIRGGVRRRAVAPV
jgi:peptidoglycan/LPS O-acetylase OafA/YrhL